MILLSFDNSFELQTEVLYTYIVDSYMASILVTNLGNRIF